MKQRLRWKTIRTTALLLIFLGLFPFAVKARYPVAAPAAVQEEGRILVRQTMEHLRQAPFGKTERGQALIAEAIRMLDADRIIFSAALGGPRGLNVTRFFGGRRIYIRVIRVNETVYLQQLDWQLAEAFIHEALHSLRGGIHAASFEEECDAFAAGLQAEFAIRGIPLPARLTLDGLPVVEFVRRSYPRTRQNHSYQPLGLTRKELILMTSATSSR